MKIIEGRDVLRYAMILDANCIPGNASKAGCLRSEPQFPSPSKVRECWGFVFLVYACRAWLGLANSRINNFSRNSDCSPLGALSSNFSSTSSLIEKVLLILRFRFLLTSKPPIWLKIKFSLECMVY